MQEKRNNMRTKDSVISRLEEERHDILPTNNDFRKGYLKAIELALYLVKDIKEKSK